MIGGHLGMAAFVISRSGSHLFSISGHLLLPEVVGSPYLIITFFKAVSFIKCTICYNFASYVFFDLLNIMRLTWDSKDFIPYNIYQDSAVREE